MERTTFSFPVKLLVVIPTVLHLLVVVELLTSFPMMSVTRCRPISPIRVEDISEQIPKRLLIRAPGHTPSTVTVQHLVSAHEFSANIVVEHFLGLSGRISGSYDVDYVSITNAVNEVLRTNDHVNAATGQIDVRHMYGMTNHDIFRWPAVTDGRIKSYLGVAMLNLLLPGIPLLYFGEEQDMLLLDNTAPNYICK